MSQPADDVWLAYAPADGVVEVIDRLKRDARTRLDALARAEFGAGHRVLAAVEWGDPADEILRYASEHRIDLAPCPVFTVRAEAAQRAA